MSLLRRCAQLFRRTPLHPQWLLPPRRLPVAQPEALSGRLLDVGAGDRWLQAVLPANLHYVALDYPATGRDLYHAGPRPTGRDHYHTLPDVFADAAQLPFADASFDHVACLEVLEHVPAPAQVLGEIARVLKAGGSAWLSLPFLYPVHDAPYDFRRYTEHGLRLRLAGAGLELVSLRRSGHAVATAGLLGCLALAGGLQATPAPLALLLLPLALPLILLLNLACALLARLWPDWPALTAGYELEVRKP